MLPPIKNQLRAALLNLTAYKEIPTEQLIAAARALPGGTKVLCPQGFGWGHDGHRIVSSKTATSNFE